MTTQLCGGVKAYNKRSICPKHHQQGVQASFHEFHANLLKRYDHPRGRIKLKARVLPGYRSETVKWSAQCISLSHVYFTFVYVQNHFCLRSKSILSCILSCTDPPRQSEVPKLCLHEQGVSVWGTFLQSEHSSPCYYSPGQHCSLFFFILNAYQCCLTLMTGWFITWTASYLSSTRLLCCKCLIWCAINVRKKKMEPVQDIQFLSVPLCWIWGLHHCASETSQSYPDCFGIGWIALSLLLESLFGLFRQIKPSLRMPPPGVGHPYGGFSDFGNLVSYGQQAPHQFSGAQGGVLGSASLASSAPGSPHFV